MTAINAYLNFPGTTEEAFNFYKTIFGGEFLTLMRYRDLPAGEEGGGEGCDGMKIADGELDKIMHVALPVGGSVLMATDTLESFGQKLAEENNFSLSLETESREEADRFFGELSESGKVEMPLADAFWGHYFGMLEDKFGVRWMINYNNNSK